MGGYCCVANLALPFGHVGHLGHLSRWVGAWHTWVAPGECLDTRGIPGVPLWWYGLGLRLGIDMPGLGQNKWVVVAQTPGGETWRSL